jgi:hypothetical protein
LVGPASPTPFTTVSFQAAAATQPIGINDAGHLVGGLHRLQCRVSRAFSPLRMVPPLQRPYRSRRKQGGVLFTETLWLDTVRSWPGKVDMVYGPPKCTCAIRVRQLTVSNAPRDGVGFLTLFIVGLAVLMRGRPAPANGARFQFSEQALKTGPGAGVAAHRRSKQTI